MTPAPDQLRDFARRYTEAWCSQDPARVAENYAPDGSLTINDGPPSVAAVLSRGLDSAAHERRFVPDRGSFALSPR
jgi:hypothetical protein